MRSRVGCILVAMMAAAATAPAAAAPDPPADGGGVARLIVAGARDEVARGTVYDLTMGYYVTTWKDGTRTANKVYPGGDIDPAMGVCVEVPIRAFRRAGIDLQALVHDDMARAPAAYGVAGRKLDTNIDHRRVANLFVFFKRHAKVLPTATDGAAALAAWKPGDVVIWQLTGSGRTDHVGLVSDRRDPASGRPLVIHNYPMPGHAAEADVLTAWKIAGHFRYGFD
jgi:uncharacterized protein YijF (DUF1287 family)